MRRKTDREAPAPLTEEDALTIRSISEDIEHWLRGRKARFFVTIGLLLVVLGGIAVLSTGVIRNVNRIDEAQKKADKDRRETSYRQCVRGSVNRAELQLASTLRPGDRPIRLARERRVPIVNCWPLREGKVEPTPLPVSVQRVVVRFYGATCRIPYVTPAGSVTTTPNPYDGQRSVHCLPTRVPPVS